MDAIRIRGGTPLHGTVRVSGAKNAALPILCATLLSPDASVLHNVPSLRDIHTLAALLRFLGRTTLVDAPIVRVEREDGTPRPEAPYELVKQMRASVMVLGPLVARYGKAKVSLPGGCAIGARPIDQHLKGLEAMGASIELDRGYVIAKGCDSLGGRLHGADIRFDLITVTGTENLMMAAALAHGETVLRNCACEPEVVDLANVLVKMGAVIDGAGTDVMRIQGQRELRGFEHDVVADRIEAGTFMVAAAATGGDVFVQGAPVAYLDALIAKLRQAGGDVFPQADGVRVRGNASIAPVDITTEPHPGFPTDMQAQFMVLMSLARGRCTITETIFDNRFMHVSELARMGACIDVRGNQAIVTGVTELSGASVMATDLRASASLVIAGLVAKNYETEVRRVYHLDRGYEFIEQKLAGLGADIRRVKDVGG